MSKINKSRSGRKSEDPYSINRKDFTPSTEDIGDRILSNLPEADADFRKSRITGRLSLISNNKKQKRTTTIVPYKYPVDLGSSLPKHPSVNTYKETDRKAKLEYVGSHNQVCDNCHSRFSNMVIEMVINDEVDFDHLKKDISEINIPCPVCKGGTISVSLYRIKETKNRVKDIDISEGELSYESGGN